jgi:MerR family transcriptional regulator, light-induced transcriptional regulator
MEILPTREKQDKFRELILLGDRKASSFLVRHLLDQDVPVQVIYEELIKKALYQVGDLWEQSRITVAEEHLATSVSEAVMNELFPLLLAKTRRKKKVLLACVENELHQVGVKMVADIFEMKGWDSFFPGSNVPLKELITYAGKVKPDLFALSVSIYFHMPELEKMLGELLKCFPDIPILVGGQAFRHSGADPLGSFSGVSLIPDLYALEKFIDQFDRQE